MRTDGRPLHHCPQDRQGGRRCPSRGARHARVAANGGERPRVEARRGRGALNRCARRRLPTDATAGPRPKAASASPCTTLPVRRQPGGAGARLHRRPARSQRPGAGSRRPASPGTGGWRHGGRRRSRADLLLAHLGAASPDVANGDWPAVHAKASASLKALGIEVLFRDPTGQQVMNARVPGAPRCRDRAAGDRRGGAVDPEASCVGPGHRPHRRTTRSSP